MDPMQAQQIIAAMNAGQIPWDDGLRAAANNSGGGGIPMFNFDYAAEAQKAYGELGTYYDRILKESEGDMNKVLARLVSDYDRGVRIKKRDTETALGNTQRSVMDNALARGIYQKSAYGAGGYGLADAELARRQQPLQQAQTDYEELYGPEGIYRKRAQEDTATKIERNRFEKEQQRRQQASELANSRGARAYQDYQYKNLYNPSLV